MDKVKKPARTYEIYFTNPWCPLFGSLPLEIDFTNLKSERSLCKNVIYSSRDKLKIKDKDVYGFFGPETPLAPGIPCDKCKKREMRPCNSNAQWLLRSRESMQAVGFRCKKWDTYINKSMDFQRIFLCPPPETLPKYNRQKLLAARTIFNNVSIIKDRLDLWIDYAVDIFTQHPSGFDLYGNDLWAAPFEKPLEWARYRDDGQIKNVQDDLSDIEIVFIVSISLAWYVLRDIYASPELEEDNRRIIDSVPKILALFLEAMELKTFTIHSGAGKMKGKKIKKKKDEWYKSAYNIKRNDPNITLKEALGRIYKEYNPSNTEQKKIENIIKNSGLFRKSTRTEIQQKNDPYKKDILDLIKIRGRSSREDIDTVLFDKIPNTLPANKKKLYISNLLKALQKDKQIRCIHPDRRKMNNKRSYWILFDPARGSAKKQPKKTTK